uniref:cell growth regulator with EF hand domain protein 1 n=1 Tax=Semicossyphus pulcher TaxID=241346 RepID=UPI0037E77DDC
MQTGVFGESTLGRLFLILLIHQCLAAPGFPGTQGEESVVTYPSSGGLANPFGSGVEERRLLHSFVQAKLTDDQGGPDITTWEQEVFFLFSLYDYDKNGLLDGLELMKLVSEFNIHHTPEVQAALLVESLVDVLLQTQDLNQDGLLNPLELLSHPLPKTQDSSNNNAPQQRQEGNVEEKLSHPGTEEETTEAAAEQHEEHPQHEVEPEEEELTKQEDEHQIPEDHNIPVHQGQPEM